MDDKLHMIFVLVGCKRTNKRTIKYIPLEKRSIKILSILLPVPFQFRYLIQYSFNHTALSTCIAKTFNFMALRTAKIQLSLAILIATGLKQSNRVKVMEC